MPRAYAHPDYICARAGYRAAGLGQGRAGRYITGTTLTVAAGVLLK
ncbi:hypothetical protein [Mycobacterium lentiflavum]|nr:hypothetical protein [Mycobacterium lentiflavum]